MDRIARARRRGARRAGSARRRRSRSATRGREVVPARARPRAARPAARRSTSATPFDLASLTKPMATAALAMVLVARRPARPRRAGRAAGSPTPRRTGTVRAAARPRRRLRGARRVLPRLRARASRSATRARRARAREPRERARRRGGVQRPRLHPARRGRSSAPPACRSRTRSPTLVAAPLGARRARFGADRRSPARSRPSSTSAASSAASSTTRTRYYGGGVCGHAGLFATIGDVARFAAAIVDAARHARGRSPDVVPRFVDDRAAPGASWRLGWDTPSHDAGRLARRRSLAARAAPSATSASPARRCGSISRAGAGSSLLDEPRAPDARAARPTAIKALRRAVGDAVVDALAMSERKARDYAKQKRGLSEHLARDAARQVAQDEAAPGAAGRATGGAHRRPA